MSNGYVLAAKTDLATAQEVGLGFGLELIDPATIGDRDAAAPALAGAANLGLVISRAGANDAHFVALLQTLAVRAPRAQLIAVEADARNAFPFLPAGWAHMTLAEARNRLAEMARRQQQQQAAAAPPPEPPPAPPEPEPPPPVEEPEPEPIPATAAPVVEETVVEAADAAPDAEEEDEDGPTPEQVRDYVRAQMRAFYDDKQNVGPILSAVDGSGLADFVAATLATPEDEDASPAANVLRALMQLAIAALHARGVNVLNAGFGAVADEATRLADAADIDALADMMRYASERDEDPMQIVRDAGAVLSSEAATAEQNAPQEEEHFGADETPSGGESEEETQPSTDSEGGGDLLADDDLSDAWSEDREAPPIMPAPAPYAPPPQAATPAPRSAEPAPDYDRAISMGRARRDEEDAGLDESNPPLSQMDKPLDETPPPAAKKEQPPADQWRQQSTRSVDGPVDMHSRTSGFGGGVSSSGSAPADASAFAPKKLRRGEAELVQVVIHQPKDLRAVIKAARKADDRTDPAPTGMRIGDIALGETVGVALETRGATCNGEVQRRTWTGAPLTFAFTAEAEADVKQAVFIARVFVGDAQIGMIAFTRGISGPKKKAAGMGDPLRLKRHKRVFLSYSSKDRETVSAIATAYQAAGIEHFFDRTSLKSGEEWSPRLKKEIDRADLFHLCWSKSAAQSEWVEQEATHALIRRNRSNGKTPNITVQMLDGPPWAPHPRALDSINFDDFVRAAIVGYARGDGSA